MRHNIICTIHMPVVLGLLFSAITATAALKEVVDEDVRCRSAQELLKEQLRANNLRIGYDGAKSRLIILKSEQMEMDPSRDPDFIEKRTHIERQLFLECQCEIAERVAVHNVSSDDEKCVLNEKKDNNVSHFFKQPVIGMQILKQAESFDGKVYQMAMVAVWSKKLEKSARSIMLGDDDRKFATNVTFSDWLSGIDLSSISMPHFVYDDKGLFHVIGVGVCAVNGNIAHDRAAHLTARMRASSSIMRSLYADCERRCECKSVLDKYSDEHYTCRQSMRERSEAKSEGNLVGLKEVRNGIVTCPFSGSRVYVSVCEINCESVALGRDQEKDMFAATCEANVKLSSAVGRQCIKGEFVGIGSFSCHTKGDGFAEEWKKAFVCAYMQSLDNALQSCRTNIKGGTLLDVQFDGPDARKPRVSSSCTSATSESQISENTTGWTENTMIRNEGNVCKSAQIYCRDELQQTIKQTLVGALHFSQEDQYDSKTGVYSVRVKLDGTEPKRGAMSIDECIAHTDFNKMIGPRRYRDKDGCVWLFGIGKSDAADSDEAMRRSAEDAMKFLKMAAGVDYKLVIQSLEGMGQYDGDVSSVAQQLHLQRSISSAANVVSRLAFAKQRKFVGTDEHPLTGMPIHTTVYVVNTKGL